VTAHWKVPQLCGAVVVQAPLPSQVVAGVKVLPSLLQIPGVQA
jgi:hypothetical protein